MKILLFGVSQVGKSTVAKVLAKKLNFIFIDPDYYIIDKFGSVEEFQKIYSDIKERYKVKTDIIIKLCKENDNIVIPVSPIYSIKENERIIAELPEVYKYNLVASPNIIFERVGYYDENGVLLPNSLEFKMNHKKRIMLEIINDNRSNDYEFQYYEKIDTDLLKVNQVACEIIRRIRKSKKNN